MQDRCSGSLPMACHRDRIIGEDGFARVVALFQPDTPAIAQVNGRQDDHLKFRVCPAALTTTPSCAIAVKFARSRRPSAPLFSGWNCVPIRLRCPTTLAKGVG